jgi:hypothetical protein
LVSLNKAIAIAQPLVASNPDDPDALQALANAQESLSQVKFWNETGKSREAIAYMQAATKTSDRLAALPNVTPAQLIAASRRLHMARSAMNWARTLGTSSLTDSSAAALGCLSQDH